MEFEVKAKLELPKGLHTGIISKIEYREQPYPYTEVFIKEDKTGFELKTSYPSFVSAGSKLGKLINKFKEIKQGDKIDPEIVLLNKKVEFMTMNKTTDQGTFIEIVEGTIEPLQEEQDLKKEVNIM